VVWGVLCGNRQLSRMLDRMGIWNCAFSGSVSIKHGSGEEAESRYFAIVDEQEGSHTATGHQWLAVPPFDVVDATLRYQRWGNGWVPAARTAARAC
jgi:hypothetical protein